MVDSSTPNSERRWRMFPIVFMIILPAAWTCIPTHSGSTPGISNCAKCIPDAMYDETITCPMEDGKTCSIIPASEALFYNSSDTCMEAYFRCPPDSKFQLNLEPPRPESEFDSSWWQMFGFRMICSGSPIGTWVLTAAPRTEPNPPADIIKSITCYVQVPQACVSCDPALITVSGGFTTDFPSTINGCLTRTLTCPTAINYGSGMIPGPATMTITCNAANTAWMYMGTEITQATCSPCVSCDPSLVNVYPGFTSDSGPITVNGCLTRTLMCAAMINYNGGVIAGPATLVLTCNAANTEWTFMGAPVTQATCSQCQSCPRELISIPPGPPGFTSDLITDLNGCSQRTLTCMSANSETYIEYNGAGMISDGSTTTMTVSCNSAGTAWLFAGPPITPITQAECKIISCTNCEDIPQVMLPQDCPAGYTCLPFVLPQIFDVRDGCANRLFICPDQSTRMGFILDDGTFGILTGIELIENARGKRFACREREWRYIDFSNNINKAITNVVCLI